MTPRLPPPSQVTIDIPANDPAHVTIRMPSPHGTPTPATTPSATEKHVDNQVSWPLSTCLSTFCHALGKGVMLELASLVSGTQDTTQVASGTPDDVPVHCTIHMVPHYAVDGT